MAGTKAKIRDGEYCEIEVSEEEWDILTKGLFAAIEQTPYMNFDEVFEGIPVNYPPKEEEDESMVLKCYEEFLFSEARLFGVLTPESFCNLEEMEYVIWDIDKDGVLELVIQDSRRCFSSKYEEELWRGVIWNYGVIQIR